MAAPANAEEFLDLVRKSGVTDEKRFEPHVQRLRQNGTLPAEPSKLAGLLVRDGYLTHFQAEQILQGKWRRFTIGKYKVLEPLGSGGMGSVYLCEHKLMRRRVAVKVLPTAKAKDPSSLERFYREARAVAALDHPNIVHAYDIDQDEALHFLVMEYVDGSSLQDIVKKTGPLDPIRACHYMRQAAQGLEHAHEAGLVHRDIKPGNILVDRAGTVKVLDMGLARFFNDEEDILTKKYDENVLGTADYLAPEQALDSHAVDIRADIYSLGATFYFVLSGKTPFGEGTVAQKLIWHQTRLPKPIQDMRPDVPPGIAAVLGKMLEKDPANRYQTPAEVAAALDPFTQRDIPPPSEREMPTLSPAAVGAVPTDNLPDTVVRTGSGSGPGGRPPSSKPQVAPPIRSATPQPRPLAPAAVTAAPRPSVPAPLPAALAPAGPRQDENEDMDESAPWEKIAADTVGPSAQLDTAPQGSFRRERRPQQLETKSRKRLWIVSTVVGSVLLVVLIGLVIRFVFLAPSAGPDGPAARPVLTVTRNPAGKPYHYSSITDALRSAQRGDIIEIAEETIEENVALQPEGVVSTELVLRAAPGTSVLWKSKRQDAKAPLLFLTRAAGFRFEGKGITLDGTLKKGKVLDLVKIHSFCPDLKLEGLQFQSYDRSGVFIVNAAGEKNRPILLDGLTGTIAGKALPQQCLVYFDADEKTRPNQNAWITLSNSQVAGLPAARLVATKDASVNGANVVLP